MQDQNGQEPKQQPAGPPLVITLIAQPETGRMVEVMENIGRVGRPVVDDLRAAIAALGWLKNNLSESLIREQTELQVQERLKAAGNEALEKLAQPEMESLGTDG